MYKRKIRCKKKGCLNIVSQTEEYCPEHKPKLMVNNPEGNNAHTPKVELRPKNEHPYRVMNRDDQFNELRRLTHEQRYYSAMVRHYSQKISFIMSVMGIRQANNEAEKRAKTDFIKKEGENA